MTSAMEPDLSRIRWKLSKRYAVISSCVLLLFGIAVFLEVSRARSVLLREQARQLASSAASQMPLILHESEEYKLKGKADAAFETDNLSILDGQSPSLGTKRVVLFNRNMRVLSEYGTMKVDALSARPKANINQRQDLTLPNGVAYWRPVYLRETAGSDRELEGYVLSAVSSLNADRELVRLRNGLLVGGVVGALAAALLSQWMVVASLKPIRAQIQRLLRFTSDASHELRHPLTAIRAVIGSARERGHLDHADPELVHKVQLIDQATTSMTALVEDLLLLTRLDQALPDHRHWQLFNLCELVEDLIALYEDRAASQRIRLERRLESSTWIHGNPDQLRRLLSNLLVNALQFTPAGGMVQLAVEQRGHHIAVVVEDTGPGIPPEQRQQVFERFWQADAARSGPHSGLGLAIARSIALAHAGTLEAQAASGGGCRMLLLLPAAGPRRSRA